jgi:hypothetical protein
LNGSEANKSSVPLSGSSKFMKKTFQAAQLTHERLTYRIGYY